MSGFPNTPVRNMKVHVQWQACQPAVRICHLLIASGHSLVFPNLACGVAGDCWHKLQDRYLMFHFSKHYFYFILFKGPLDVLFLWTATSNYYYHHLVCSTVILTYYCIHCDIDITSTCWLGKSVLCGRSRCTKLTKVRVSELEMGSRRWPKKRLRTTDIVQPLCIACRGQNGMI